MDWSGLPALGYGAAGFIVILMGFCMQMAFGQRRLADKTQARYWAEAADHDKDVKRLEAALDTERARTEAERALRRASEERVDVLIREVRSLQTHVTQIPDRVAEVIGNHDDP